MVRAEDLMQVPVLTVEATAPLVHALERMDESGYAQLPVMGDGGEGDHAAVPDGRDGDRESKRTASSRLFGTLRGEDVRNVYRTLSDQVGVRDVQNELTRIQVGDVCGPPLPVIPPKEGLSEILQRLWHAHAMLVEGSGKYEYGIITATDVLAQSRPLLLITELEGHLRACIAAVLETADDNWWMHRIPKDVRTRCEGRLHAELKRADDGEPHPPSSLLAFASFGDYLTIVQDEHNWNAAFDEVFRSRTWLSTRLESVQQIRNAVAHSRSLESDQVEVLEGYVHELLDRMEPYLN